MTNPVKTILIVVTSHDRLGDSGEPTGLWLEELATPYYVFHDAGADVTLASIEGGKVPFDPRSVGGTQPPSVARFLADGAALAAAETSRALDTVDFAAYDAIFFPGGHGTMWDLPQSLVLAEQLGRAFERGQIVATVCHGAAALVSARRADGRSVVAGRMVNSFTDAEEAAVGLTNTVPFLLESRLRALGGDFRGGPDFQPFLVQDGPLITGQNPQSSQKVAEAVLAALIA